MAQFSRPDADDAIGVWTNSAGTQVNLWSYVDEATADDADFVQNDAPAAGELCDLGLSTITDPQVSTGHVIRWRYRKNAAAGKSVQVTLKLRQGATDIVTRTFSAISEVWTQDNYTLTAAEADSITNYANLNVRLEGIQSGGGAGRTVQVSWVELETPDAPTTRRAEVSWAEFELPLAPRRAQVSWAEFEVPLGPRRAEVSWAELEVPLGPRRAEVSWSELELPLAPRRAEISWAEIEVPSPTSTIRHRTLMHLGD